MIISPFRACFLIHILFLTIGIFVNNSFYQLLDFLLTIHHLIKQLSEGYKYFYNISCLTKIQKSTFKLFLKTTIPPQHTNPRKTPDKITKVKMITYCDRQFVFLSRTKKKNHVQKITSSVMVTYEYL